MPGEITSRFFQAFQCGAKSLTWRRSTFPNRPAFSTRHSSAPSSPRGSSPQHLPSIHGAAAQLTLLYPPFARGGGCRAGRYPPPRVPPASSAPDCALRACASASCPSVDPAGWRFTAASCSRGWALPCARVSSRQAQHRAGDALTAPLLPARTNHPQRGESCQRLAGSLGLPRLRAALPGLRSPARARTGAQARTGPQQPLSARQRGPGQLPPPCTRP